MNFLTNKQQLKAAKLVSAELNNNTQLIWAELSLAQSGSTSFPTEILPFKWVFFDPA